eukprot:1177329-Prorocentrum_minimum.AAC.1
MNEYQKSSESKNNRKMNERMRTKRVARERGSGGGQEGVRRGYYGDGLSLARAVRTRPLSNAPSLTRSARYGVEKEEGLLSYLDEDLIMWRADWLTG